MTPAPLELTSWWSCAGAVGAAMTWAGLLVARGAPRRKVGIVWLLLATALLALEVNVSLGRIPALVFIGSLGAALVLGSLWRNRVSVGGGQCRNGRLRI